MNNSGIPLSQIVKEVRNDQYLNASKNKYPLSKNLRRGDETRRELAAEALGRLARVHPEDVVFCLDEAVTAATEDSNDSVRGNCMGLIASLSKRYPEKVAMYSDQVSKGLLDSHETVVVNSVETLAYISDKAPQGGINELDEIITLLSSRNEKVRFHASIVLYNISMEYPEKVTEFIPKYFDILSNAIVDEKVKLAIAGIIQNIAEAEPGAMIDRIDLIHTSIVESSDYRVQGNLTGALAELSKHDPETVSDYANSLSQLLHDTSNYENKLNLSTILYNVVKYDPRIFEQTNMKNVLRQIYVQTEHEGIRENISLIIREIKENKQAFSRDIVGDLRSDFDDGLMNNIIELANAVGEQTVIQIDSFIDEMKNTNNTNYEITDGSVADINNPQTGLNRRDE